MIFSLNEIEVMARKAVRGSGHSWGTAEEAGFATRWLAEQGVDGVAALARLLVSGEIKCPIRAGAAFCDDPKPISSAGFHLSHMTEPLLLLPFLSLCAEADGSLEIVGTTGRARVARGAIQMTGRLRTPLRIMPNHVKLMSKPLRIRGFAHPSDWLTLTQLAHRTYAPATDASRRLGAGAGLSDND